MTHEETFNSFVSELSEPWREKLKENGKDITELPLNVQLRELREADDLCR